MNLYGYVGLRPQMATDPLGLCGNAGEPPCKNALHKLASDVGDFLSGVEDEIASIGNSIWALGTPEGQFAIHEGVQSVVKTAQDETLGNDPISRIQNKVGIDVYQEEQAFLSAPAQEQRRKIGRYTTIVLETLAPLAKARGLTAPAAGRAAGEIADVTAAADAAWDAEIGNAVDSARSGQPVQFSDATGGTRIEFQTPPPRAPLIWWQEKLTIPGVGPEGKAVELRIHSPNPTAPAGSYSRSNYSIQINTVEPPGVEELTLIPADNQPLALAPGQLPAGTWKQFSKMNEAEKRATHMRTN